ncbi:MAG: WXG100 family type VII secretion target [Dermatophilaceae bacterium]
MANITHGMNVESVKSIAKQLTQQASAVEQVIGAVDKLITQAQTDWLGKDSAQFQEIWRGTYKQRLVALKDELNTLSSKATQNAAKQEEVSAQLG